MIHVNWPFNLMSNCEDGEKFTKEEMVFSDGNNKKKKNSILKAIMYPIINLHKRLID